MLYRVYISGKIESQLQDFLSCLKDYFYQLYENTGILDIDKILHEYDVSFDFLYTQIKNQIQEKGESGLLGRKVIQSDNEFEKSINTFYIKSYRIEFEAEMNLLQGEVYIQSIKITT